MFGLCRPFVNGSTVRFRSTFVIDFVYFLFLSFLRSFFSLNFFSSFDKNNKNIEKKYIHTRSMVRSSNGAQSLIEWRRWNKSISRSNRFLSMIFQNIKIKFPLSESDRKIRWRERDTVVFRFDCHYSFLSSICEENDKSSKIIDHICPRYLTLTGQIKMCLAQSQPSSNSLAYISNYHRTVFYVRYEHERHHSRTLRTSLREKK